VEASAEEDLLADPMPLQPLPAIAAARPLVALSVTPLVWMLS
jgi:hypothetical protein